MSILKSALEIGGGVVGGALGLTAVGKVASAVKTSSGGAQQSTTQKTLGGGRGGVVGGTVVGRSHGMLLVSVGGRTLLVKTAKKHHRAYRGNSRRSSMDKLMELAMIKSIAK